MEGYFIDYTDGDVRIISTKKNSFKELSIPKSGSASYPGLVFIVNNERIRADTHRVIAENILPFPRPKSIPKKEWDKTPEIVRSHIKSLYFVNHIDHDKYNCHPSNLEWVTSKGNARAYQEHKKSL